MPDQVIKDAAEYLRSIGQDAGANVLYQVLYGRGCTKCSDPWHLIEEADHERG